MIQAWVDWDNIIYYADPELDLLLNLKIDSLSGLNLKKELTLQERDFFTRSKGFALNNLGIIHQQIGELDMALAYYEESLKMHQSVGNKKGASNPLNNMGAIYEDKGLYDKAIDLYAKGMKIAEDLGDIGGISAGYGNIGKHLC